MKISKYVSERDISKEWDSICEARNRTIIEKKDVSLLYVTAPCIINNVKNDLPTKILDVGCGTGYLTNQLSDFVDKCYGIDISKKSIEIARKQYCKNNLTFLHANINDFSHKEEFDSCVSNMVLMTDPEWMKSLSNIYRVLYPKGTLFIMITHPCYWPKYWGYQDEPWFDYNSEIFINKEFSISMVKDIGMTTHIHRPLTQYFNVLIKTGFIIEKIEEPYPVAKTPLGYQFEYPRFLFLKCRKK